MSHNRETCAECGGRDAPIEIGDSRYCRSCAGIVAQKLALEEREAASKARNEAGKTLADAAPLAAETLIAAMRDQSGALTVAHVNAAIAILDRAGLAPFSVSQIQAQAQMAAASRSASIMRH